MKALVTSNVRRRKVMKHFLLVVLPRELTAGRTGNPWLEYGVGRKNGKGEVGGAKGPLRPLSVFTLVSKLWRKVPLQL